MEEQQLWKKIIDADSEQKARFKAIILYVNANKSKLKSYMNETRALAFKNLIVAWNKKDKNVQDYFDMKDYHTQINGTYPNNEFKKLWDAYIQTGMKMRIDLMKLNHMLQN